MIKRLYLDHIIRCFLGAAAISLGTFASKTCPYPILAPLLFAVGILMVMRFDWHLITRHFPTQPLNKVLTPLIIVCNLLFAYLIGLFSDLTITPTQDVLYLFLTSIAGGAVIGLVSLNNLTDHPYKVPIALLLMYVFVMLGLPHCVVYAFLNVSLSTLLVVLAGNVVGGLALRWLDKGCKLNK